MTRFLGGKWLKCISILILVAFTLFVTRLDVVAQQLFKQAEFESQVFDSDGISGQVVNCPTGGEGYYTFQLDVSSNSRSLGAGFIEIGRPNSDPYSGNVVVRVIDPDGQYYGTDKSEGVSAHGLEVLSKENADIENLNSQKGIILPAQEDGLLSVIVRDPKPGIWTIEVSSNTSAGPFAVSGFVSEKDVREGLKEGAIRMWDTCDSCKVVAWAITIVIAAIIAVKIGVIGASAAALTALVAFIFKALEVIVGEVAGEAASWLVSALVTVIEFVAAESTAGASFLAGVLALLFCWTGGTGPCEMTLCSEFGVYCEDDKHPRLYWVKAPPESISESNRTFEVSWTVSDFSGTAQTYMLYGIEDEDGGQIYSYSTPTQTGDQGTYSATITMPADVTGEFWFNAYAKAANGKKSLSIPKFALYDGGGQFYVYEVTGSDINHPDFPAWATNRIVGAPDNNLISLGNGGYITVKMARSISDGTGNDFKVYEVGSSLGGTSEGYHVYGTSDCDSPTWTYIGYGSDVTSFELPNGLNSVQCLKLVDAGTSSGKMTGADFDAVEGLNSSTTSSDEVLLTSKTPQTTGTMKFTYSGAQYDTYYTDPPHWKIVNHNGYMNFSFSGKKDFVFHALGSTSSGVSYCYVTFHVNGSTYNSNYFIDKEWIYYRILSSAFGSGSNSVKIELVGDTHFWIDKAGAGVDWLSTTGVRDESATISNQSPNLEATMDGTTVTISVDPVSGAESYTLVYTPADFSYTGEYDMGTSTTVSFNLWSGAAFNVTVEANKNDGTTVLTDAEYFQVP